MPINGKLGAKIRKFNSSSMTPLFSADLLFSNVSISLNDSQYRNILSVLDYVTNFGKYEKFRKILPQYGFNNLHERKEWWRFAILAMKQQMQQNVCPMIAIDFNCQVFYMGPSYVP